MSTTVSFFLLASLALVAVVSMPAPDPVFKLIVPANVTEAVQSVGANLESGNRLKSWLKSKGKGYPEEQGNYFEGDMILPGPLTRSSATSNTARRWPSAQVFCVFPDNLPTTEFNVIAGAMQIISANTCVGFYYRSTQTDYINFEVNPTGCWSYVGRIGGKQSLNLQLNGCFWTDTVIHELLHALGFNHEQSRTDRDQFVNVQYQNIQPGTEHNFNIEPSQTYLSTPYDFKSVMHYSQYAFSINNQPTIVPWNQNVVIERNGLSQYDIAAINRMYNC